LLDTGYSILDLGCGIKVQVLLPDALRLTLFFEPEFGLGMKKVIKMREMSDNQGGIIKKVTAGGDMGRRLREMGLVPETVIKIQGRAPLRDPVAVKLRDFVLTLRNNEASSIFVEVDVPETDGLKDRGIGN